jgi:hypothetical protein
MPLFLRRLLQVIADWALKRSLHRQDEKIRLVQKQDIDADVKRAAVEEVKRIQEELLEKYLHRP